MEGEGGRPAAYADVRRCEWHDSGELERRYDEQCGGDRMRHAERAAREGRGGDPRHECPADPDCERCECRAVRGAQRREQRTRTPGAAARAEPCDEQRRHGQGGERQRIHRKPVVDRAAAIPSGSSASQRAAPTAATAPATASVPPGTTRPNRVRRIASPARPGRNVFASEPAPYRAQASGNRIPPPSIALQLAALHARATAKQQPERTSSPGSALRTAARIACIAHIFRSPAPVPGRAAGPAPHRHRSVTRGGGGAAASRRAAARRAPA